MASSRADREIGSVDAGAPLPRTRFSRPPGPAVRPYVHLLWAIDESPFAIGAPVREHVVPTGQMHLVVRLSDGPLRLLADLSDSRGEAVADVVLGGAREAFYVREVQAPQCSVGAQLRPGATEALFGIPADEFTGRHTPLLEICGRRVTGIRERLAMVPSLEARIDRFESILLTLLPRPRALHPAVARALAALPASDVRSIVVASGYSHRTMIALFRRSVGLAPKQYARILRFQHALRRMPAESPLADLAMASDYSDQAHFSREFRHIAGVTPSEYRRISPAFPHHLRLPARLG